MRILLACDGEQVLQARVEVGYASRRLAQRMCAASWTEAGELATALVPSSPSAGAVAYARAVDRLCGTQNHDLDEEGWLASDTAKDTTRWAAKLLGLLGVRRRLQAVLRIRERAADAETLERLARELEHDRWLALRLRGIGCAPDGIDARARQMFGPAGADARDRILLRLLQAAEGIRQHRAGPFRRRESHPTDVPRGETTVEVSSARGPVQLRLRSNGGRGPAAVEWKTPTGAALPHVPELLAGLKLADAEVALASVDLCAAEVDL
jgi:Ni,Fe-hydrogenase III large subunit